mgnify:CR=1 FL=1
MIVKNSIRWMIPALILTLTISGCSMFGTKKIEVSSKPIEIDIIQPTMPRNIDLKDPVWHVVSSAKIANTKSVCASGKNSSFCKLLPNPCPNQDPRPYAIKD